MPRNSVSTKLYGATELDVDTDESPEVPEWMDSFNQSTTKTVGEWTETVTQHKLVSVAFGEGDDTSRFEMADGTKMVVTIGDETPVTTVSDRFNLVDNQRVIAVLVDVLDNLDLNTSVFGEGNAYRDKFVIDLFFEDDNLVTDTGGSKIATGISLVAANDKSSSIRVCPTAWDGYSQSMIRGVGDGWNRVKHVKPEDVSSDEKDMYDKLAYMITETILGLEDVADEWRESVRQASELEVEFDYEDFTPEQFYKTWLDDQVPQKVIDSAVKNSQVRAGIIGKNQEARDSPSQSFWSLVMGFTYGYTHASSMSDGPTKRRFHKTAKEAILSSEQTLNQIRRDFVVDTESEGEADSNRETTQEDLTVVERAAETSEEIRQTKLMTSGDD